MYATVLQAVKEELFSHLLLGVPAGELGKLDLPRRLLLPSDITVATWPLPQMTSNYWRNLLLVKNLTRLAYREWAFAYYLGSLGSTALLPRITSIGEFIVVSPSAYAVLEFGQDIPDFINAATFGIRLTSTIWRYIYNTNRFQDGVQKRFLFLFGCPDVKRSSTSDVFLPYLCLPTIIRSYHTANTWRSPVGPEKLRRISRGQLFYILYFLHSSCQYAVYHRGESTLYPTKMASLLNIFMIHVHDFQCTFDCPLISRANQCFPTVTDSKDCAE